MIVLSFVAALSVAGCSKKKADTTPTNAATTETKAADPCAAKTADPCAGKTADPCAADPCAKK
ncbi:MAG: hypothetical protein M4D80_15050 [Myxococcota bacterium]|nr:hypothetical protein [Myxococcota bacterium]